MDNIKVGIRVRPLLPKDTGTVEWITQDDCVSPKTPPCTPYQFDHVFGMNNTTDLIYKKLAEPIVEGVMEGINGTIFAYGQTASGKTFTMMGEEEKHPGIILQACNHIFAYIQEHPEREHLIRASYLEIYNESLTDLLNPNQKLRIREDTSRNFLVHRLTEEPVTTPQDIYSLIEVGERNRSFGKTNANEHSSRSHTIFKVTVESRLVDEELSDGTIRVASLSLVDLAGSERVSVTAVTGKQFKEGTSINLSLHVLGKVISKLSEGNVGHVPYRESKLTSILQPSIGGNSKTCIICTINPCELAESHSTLQFASRAKTIKNKPIVNEVVCGEDALRKKLTSVERENTLLKEKLDQGLPEQEREALTQQLALTELQKTRLEERMKALEDLIVRSNVTENPTKPVKAKIPRRMTMCPSLLSRDTSSFRATPFLKIGVMDAPLKKPTPGGKVVSFAPTPRKDESFQVHYSPSEFAEHLQFEELQEEDVRGVRSTKRIRGRPSFLPAPDFFEDSLDETQCSPSIHQDIMDKDEMIQTLQRQCADLEREKSSLVSELKESRHAVSQLEADLLKELEEKVLESDQAHIIEGLKSEVEDSKKTITSLKDELLTATQQHGQEKLALKSELLTASEAYSQTKLTLEAELKDTLDRCKMLQSEVEDFQKTVRSLETELKSSAEEYFEERMTLQNKLRTLTQENSSQKVALEHSEQAVCSLQSDLQDAAEEKKVVQAELEEVLNRFKELAREQGSEVDKTAELTESEKMISSLKIQLQTSAETYTQEKSVLESELKEALEQSKQFKSELKHSEEAVITLKNELQSSVNDHSREIAALESELRVSQQAISKLQTDTEALSQKKLKLGLDIEESKKTIALLQAAKEEHSQEKSVLELELKERIASLQEEHSQERLMLQSESNERITSLQEEYSRERLVLQSELKESKETITSLQEEHYQDKLGMECELKQALDRCRQLEQSSVPSVDGVDILECYEQEKEEIQKELEEKGVLISELRELHSSIETRLSHTKEQYRSDLADLQESVTSLRAGLAAAKTSIEESVQEKLALESELKKALDRCRELEQNSEVDKRSLQFELESIGEAIPLQSEGVEESQEIMALKGKLQAATEEVSRWKVPLEECEQTVSSLKTELQSKAKGHAQEKEELQSELEASNQTISSLRSGLQTANEDYSALEFTLQDVLGQYKQLEQSSEAEKQSLESELVELKQRVSTLTGELQREADEHSQEKLSLLSELKETLNRYKDFQQSSETGKAALESKLEELLKVISSIKSELQASFEENACLESSLKEVLSQCTQLEQRNEAAKLALESKLQQATERYRAEVEVLNSKVEALEEKATAAESKGKASEEELGKVQFQLKDTLEYCEMYKEDKEKAQQETATAEKFEYELELERNKLLKELKEKTKAIVELEKKVSQTNTDSAQLKELQEQVDSYKLEIETLQRGNDEYKSEVELLNNKITSFEQMLATAEAKLKGSEEELGKVQFQLKDTLEYCEMYKEDKERAQQETDTAEKHEYEVELERDKLRKELKEKNEALSKLQKTLLEQQEVLKENVEPNTPVSEDTISLKQQIKDICKLRTTDQRQHRYAMAELQDTLDAVRDDNRKLKEKIQGMGAKPSAVPMYPTVSGVVTDVLYHDLRHEYTKLQKISEKEREDMQRYRRDRSVYRTKFMAMKKLCHCKSLERAQSDPNFTLT